MTASQGFIGVDVLDPRPDSHGGPPAKTAPRLDSLEGKTIGLLWNGKANGDVALRRAAELIGERHTDVKFKFYSGSMPCPPELLDELVNECDAAIGCTADCGSCTSWMTHDCVQIERKGLPTVIIASHGFEHDVEVSARAFAMPDPFYVVVPQVYNNLDEAAAAGQTEPVVEQIVARLTVDESGSGPRADSQPLPQWSYSAADPTSPRC